MAGRVRRWHGGRCGTGVGAMTPAAAQLKELKKRLDFSMGPA
jgi:hypothetical protein